MCASLFHDDGVLFDRMGTPIIGIEPEKLITIKLGEASIP